MPLVAGGSWLPGSGEPDAEDVGDSVGMLPGCLDVPAEAPGGEGGVASLLAPGDVPGMEVADRRATGCIEGDAGPEEVGDGRLFWMRLYLK